MIFLILLVCFLNYSAVESLEEGDVCVLPNTHKKGVCIPIGDCEPVRISILKKMFPKICGFKGSISMVCCPIERKPGKLSQEMCNDYHDRRNENYPIRYGEKAISKEFPHMVALGFKIDGTISWLCGGVLISHHFVMSAAHCSASLSGSPKWVRLGDLDLEDSADDANPQNVRIAESYLHPRYKASSFYHDLILFRLKRRISFEEYIKPACLHVEKDLPGDTFEAIGWGDLGVIPGQKSPHLMKAKLKTVDHESCANEYRHLIGNRKLKKGLMEEYQLCAFGSRGENTCPGDSGGPLHYRVNEDGDILKHFMVVGVTSFGNPCESNSTGVYTRVSAYIEWIESVVWEEYD